MEAAPAVVCRWKRAGELVGKQNPVGFQLTDLDTSATLSGTLLDIDSSLSAPGSFSWDGAKFALDATEFHFFIDIGSPHTVKQGTVDLLVAGGLITTSTSTGIFASMFASVGTTGSFSVPFGDITLGYDLGDFGDHALAISFELAGSGIAQVIAEPSRVILLGVGLLGLIGHGGWRRKRVAGISA